MIRLTKLNPNDQEAIIRIDGRLDAESLAELRQAMATSGHVAAIDLVGVTALDAVAGRFLIGLRDAGCRLFGASLYVSRLLEEIER